MKDYKHIHRDLQRHDHDYREGWQDELIGKGIVIGIVWMLVVIVIGRLV